MTILIALIIKIDIVIVTILAIKIDIAIVTALAIKINIYGYCNRIGH